VLQDDAIKIGDWSTLWLTNFNATYTENLVISKKINPSRVPIIFQNIPINIVLLHKHLGMTFSHDFTWRSHIENLLTTAHKRLGILLKSKYRFSRKTLETLYISFVRSLLDYGDVVYDICPDYLKNQIERVNKQGA
jgi:hypothetical protein